VPGTVLSGSLPDALAGTVVVVGVGGLLLLAGVEKLRAPRAFGDTLAALGVPRTTRPALGVGVPAAEIGTATALLLAPSARWPSAAVLLLAAGFAVAGMLALRVPGGVACSCLGGTGDGRLGRRQVLALPLWVAAVVVVGLDPPRWSPSSGAAVLAGLGLAYGALRARETVGAWLAARADRRALAEGAEYQPSMFVPPQEVTPS
jgi:hypothetical protein